MPRETATGRFTARPQTKSVKFDGVTSYLRKTSPTGINNGTNGPITLCGWVKLGTDTLQTCAELMAVLHAHPSFGIGQVGAVYYVFSDRVNALNNKFILKTDFLQYINVNRWAFIGFKLTPTTFSFYCGGFMLIDASAISVPIAMPAISSIDLGRGNDIAGAFIQGMAGYMKEWRAFNADLTAAQLTGIRDDNTIPSSLAGEWLMEDGAGNVADTFNVNNLTATAITWVDESPFGTLEAATGRVDIPDTNSAAVVASGTLTVLDHTIADGVNATGTMTVTDWTAMAGGNFNILSGMGTLTEGVTADFVAETSNEVTAANAAAAMVAAFGPGIATAVGADINFAIPGQFSGGTFVWSGAGVTPTTATCTGGYDNIQLEVGGTTTTIGGGGIAIGANNDDLATNIAAWISGIGAPVGVATAVGPVVTINASTAGSAGNAITISQIGFHGGSIGPALTLSGATLSGGSDEVTEARETIT